MRVIYAVVFSAVIHLLLFWLTPEEPPGNQVPDIPVEIVYADKALPVVTETEVPPERTSPDEAPEEESPAEHWSKERVRVQKEVQARKTGPTANRGARASLAPSQKKPASGEARKLPDLMKMAQEHTAYGRSSGPGSFKEAGTSTLSTVVSEEVQVGGLTALNVDPYLHYSFLTRMNQQTYPRWYDGLVEALESLQSLDFRSTQDTWITHLEVELSEEGKFLNGRVLRESGLRSFDLAALRAFRDAGYFPNPPKDLMDDEGRILLKYAFHVKWDPRRQVRR